MRRRLKAAVRALFVLLFAGALSLIWLLTSEAGLKSLLRIADALSPASISADAVQGSITGGASLSGLQVHTADAAITFENLRFRCECRLAVFGIVQIPVLYGEGVTLETAASPGDPGAPPILPLSITIDDLQLNRVTIGDGDGEWSLDHLSLRITAGRKELRLSRLHLQAPGWQLRYNGDLEVRYPLRVGSAASWDAVLGEELPLYGTAQIAGDAESMILNIRVEAPWHGELALTLRDILDKPGWSGSLQTEWSDPRRIVPDLPAGMRWRLELAGTGTPDTASANGSLYLRQTTYLDGRPVEQEAAFDVAVAMPQAGAIPEARLAWQDLSWRLAGHGLSSRAGELGLRYVDERAVIEMDAPFVLDGQHAGHLRLHGAGDASMFRIGNAELRLQDGRMRASGSVQREAGVTAIDFEGGLERLSVPIGTEPVVLSDGQFHIAGEHGRYEFEARTAVEAGKLPAGDVALAGALEHGVLQLQEFTITTLGGEVRGSGHVGIPGTPLDLDLTARGIDPGRHWPEWPGRLAFEGRLRSPRSGVYEWRGAGDGVLRGIPVTMHLDGRLADGVLELQPSSIGSGTARAQVDGSIGEQLRLSWRLEAPDLGQVLPGSAGRLSANGRLGGTRDQPSIAATMDAREIRTPWLDAGSLDADIAADLTARRNIDITLSAADLRHGDRNLDYVKGRISGTARDHGLHLEAAARDFRVRIGGSGDLALERRRWQGRLDELDVQHPRAGNWALAAPAALSWDNGDMALAPSCVTGGATRICAGGARQRAGGWNLELESTGLPSDWLEDYLPQAVSIEAALDLQGRLSGGAGRLSTAAGSIRMGPGAVVLVSRDNPSRRMAFRHGEATLQFAEGILDAQLDVAFSDPGVRPLSATLTARGIGEWPPDPETIELEGSGVAGLDDIGAFLPPSPWLAEVSGALDVDLSLTGSAGDPRLTGDVHLRDGGFRVPRLGTRVEDIDLQGSDADDGAFAATGTLRSGPGRLQIRARLDAAGQWDDLSAAVTGDSFEVINLPEIWALATPELELVRTRDRTELNGRVQVPSARIDLDEVVLTTPISDDVVVAGPDRAGKAGRTVPPGKLDMRVTLGDDVLVTGRGISGRLTGDLHLFSGDRGKTRADGEIAIVDGSFSAYGQELAIEQGRLLYGNDELDNPRLSIRAVRNVDGVRAGVQVTGRLTNPVATLFSSPSMSQEQILAYVVFGRPLSNLGSGEGGELVAAAAALGLQNSGVLTESLSSTFGLDTLSVQTGETAESASLVIGKYLTPRLYLSYGVGLFETLSSARLRYDISRKWAVEAEHGSEVGLDLLYKIER